jgi:hypothetical protein
VLSSATSCCPLSICRPPISRPASRISGGGSGDGPTRQAIKTDIQILATAIVNNARLLVTHNLADFERLAKLAGDRIRISDVPNVHSQQDLDI